MKKVAELKVNGISTSDYINQNNSVFNYDGLMDYHIESTDLEYDWRFPKDEIEELSLYVNDEQSIDEEIINYYIDEISNSCGINIESWSAVDSIRKESFIIANAKTGEEYVREFESTSDCRHWIINHLDLSLEWEVESVEDLYQEHNNYCDKYNLEREFTSKNDILNNKGAIFEIKKRPIEKELTSTLSIITDEGGVTPKNLQEIESILYNDEIILLKDNKNDKFINIEKNYDGDLMYQIYDASSTELNDNGEIIKDYKYQLHQYEKRNLIEVNVDTNELPIDSIDRILKDVDDFTATQKEYMPILAKKIDAQKYLNSDLKAHITEDAIRMYQLGNSDTSEAISDIKEANIITQCWKNDAKRTVVDAFFDGQNTFMGKVHKELFNEPSNEAKKAFAEDNKSKNLDFK